MSQKRKIIYSFIGLLSFLFLILPFFFFVNYKLDTAIYKDSRNLVEKWITKNLNESLKKQYGFSFAYQKFEFSGFKKLTFSNAKIFNRKGSLAFKKLNISIGYQKKKITFLIHSGGIFLSWKSLKSLAGGISKQFSSKNPSKGASQNLKNKKNDYYQIYFQFQNLKTKIKKNIFLMDISLKQNIFKVTLTINNPIKSKIVAKINLKKQKINVDLENKNLSFYPIIKKIKLKDSLYYSIKNGSFKIYSDSSRTISILKFHNGKYTWIKNHFLDSFNFFYGKELIKYFAEIKSKKSHFKLEGKYNSKISKNQFSLHVKKLDAENYAINNLMLYFKNNKIQSKGGNFFVIFKTKSSVKKIFFNGNLYGDLDAKKVNLNLQTKDKINVPFLVYFYQQQKKQDETNQSYLNQLKVNLLVKEMFFTNKNLKILGLKKNQFFIVQKNQKNKHRKFEFSFTSQWRDKKIKFKKIDKNLFYGAVKSIELNHLKEIVPKVNFSSLGDVRGKWNIYITNFLKSDEINFDIYVKNQKKIVVQNSSIQKKIWSLPIFKNKSTRYDSFDRIHVFLNYQKKGLKIKNLELENQHYLIYSKDYSFKKKDLTIDFFFNQFFYDQYLSTGISADLMGVIQKNTVKRFQKFQYFYSKKINDSN